MAPFSTGCYPRIEDVFLFRLDMSFGLALTAVSEELAFRSVAKGIAERYLDRPTVLVVLTSVLFGLAHWSHGVPNVIATSLDGMILMVLFLRTGSILPSILAHYFINVLSFADAL